MRVLGVFFSRFEKPKKNHNKKKLSVPFGYFYKILTHDDNMKGFIKALVLFDI
jgi:hypothetical protein